MIFLRGVYKSSMIAACASRRCLRHVQYIKVTEERGPGRNVEYHPPLVFRANHFDSRLISRVIYCQFNSATGHSSQEYYRRLFHLCGFMIRCSAGTLRILVKFFDAYRWSPWSPVHELLSRSASISFATSHHSLQLQAKRKQSATCMQTRLRCPQRERDRTRANMRRKT